jgi:hypothetical protein
MRYFCTLFDSNYLDRGLALHESLLEQAKDFHLFIIPFDDEAQRKLQALRLSNVTLIPLSDFENDDLLRVKPSRSRGEYCWTSTPCAIDYVLQRFNLHQCTYLDADLCFYGDPGILLDEMGEKSVLITEHRYTPEYDQSATSGIYCVQFLSIKNTAEGRLALSWWRDRCLEWCYARVEDGKFGDQKYLDDWTTRFNGVHVLQHPGGGVAPWNVQQYPVNRDAAGKWQVAGNHPLIFYHFHHVEFYPDDRVDFSPYRHDADGVYSLYADYLRRLERIWLRNDLTPKAVQPDRSWRARLWALRRRWRRTYNVVDRNEFLLQWPG